MQQLRFRLANLLCHMQLSVASFYYSQDALPRRDAEIQRLSAQLAQGPDVDALAQRYRNDANEAVILQLNQQVRRVRLRSWHHVKAGEIALAGRMELHCLRFIATASVPWSRSASAQPFHCYALFAGGGTHCGADQRAGAGGGPPHAGGGAAGTA